MGGGQKYRKSELPDRKREAQPAPRRYLAGAK
jgi:hypothetical protein